MLVQQAGRGGETGGGRRSERRSSAQQQWFDRSSKSAAGQNITRCCRRLSWLSATRFSSPAPLICVRVSTSLPPLRALSYDTYHTILKPIYFNSAKYHKHALFLHHSSKRQEHNRSEAARMPPRPKAAAPPPPRGNKESHNDNRNTTRTHLPVTIAHARVIHRAGPMPRARVGTAPSLSRGHVESAQHGCHAERRQRPSIRSHAFLAQSSNNYSS